MATREVEFEKSLPLGPEDLYHAWRRVEENAGCAGSDGVTVAQFREKVERNLGELEEEWREGEYRPYPLLKIVVQKRPGSPKMRTLLVPAVRDRVFQTAVARYLSRSFEEEFLECSYGYRPGRSVDRAIARIRKLHEAGYRYVVDADIHTFFDEVDHELLLTRLARQVQDDAVLEVLRQWIHAELWDGERVKSLRKGIPQGSPISPLLANFFLEEFDQHLEQGGGRLVRYADDFLVLCKTEAGARETLEQTGAQLRELHLTLAEDKTHITDFDHGFRFLGAYFQGEATWIPWKATARLGRVLFMAKPLPAPIRGQYQVRHVAGRSTMQLAMRKAERAARQFRSVLEHSAAAPRERAAENDMAFLYLTDQGSVLRKAGDRFLVEKQEEVILDLPYHKLETVVVFGNVQVTTQALSEMLEKGVSLHFLSRQGDYKGSLLPPRGAQVELRLHQFQTYRDGAAGLSWAKEFVQAKVENGLAVLERYRRRRDPGGEFDAARTSLREARERVTAAETVAELEGMEGSAARAYFGGLMCFNGSPFPWEGRRMHPSPDPINALLSLTYTLLTQELAALLESAGLDPYLGFLHQIDYNRPSLALDVIEPFRHPLADRFVMRLLNQQVFGSDDFHREEGREGIFLKPTPLKRMLAEYEQFLLGKQKELVWRSLLRDEARKVAKALRDGSAFTAFRFDGGTEGE